VKRFGILESPKRRPSLKHGKRGWQTSSSTVPIRQRSPIAAPADVQPLDGEALAERAGPELAAELGLPPCGIRRVVKKTVSGVRMVS
jgi:hypothetical protein